MKTGKSLGVVLAALVVLVIGLALTTAAWQNHTKDKQISQAFESAHVLLTEKNPKDALEVLRGIMPLTQENRRDERVALEIECYLALRNIPRLLHLHDIHPQLFAKNEEAALFVCRALLQTGNKNAFTTLRQEWQGMETNTGAWFALDVDASLVAGKRERALNTLTSTQFEGKTEAIRLTRLALLTATDDLEKAWGYLEEASVLAPYNSDIRLFRGQILERLNKPASARVEYVAALLAEPENPRLRDQLAEFYRRQGNPQLALATWEGGLTSSAPGFLWLKAMFWSRMIAPLKQDKAGPYPENRLTPLLRYLDQLPRTATWNEELFFKIPDRTLMLSTRQELFWLRVVDLLSRDQETQALFLLERNPFKTISWHPELEEALIALLRFRKWGAFPETATSHLSAETSTHPLFRNLAASGSTPPPPLAALLKSPEAFSATFLAGGWLEAALLLHRMPELPKEFPGWVPYGLTQAFRYNRGVAEARSFAQRQPESPAMMLLKGELLLAENRVQEGLALLGQVATHNSDVGFRASWLLAMALLDSGNSDAAKKTIRQQPRLDGSLTGRELMARIAVGEGNTTEATRLYTAMAGKSVEAEIWLARQAYAEKRWDDARRLTVALAAAHPDSLQFRANLKAIDQAMKEGAP